MSRWNEAIHHLPEPPPPLRAALGGGARDDRSRRRPPRGHGRRALRPSRSARPLPRSGPVGRGRHGALRPWLPAGSGCACAADVQVARPQPGTRRSTSAATRWCSAPCKARRSYAAQRTPRRHARRSRGSPPARAADRGDRHARTQHARAERRAARRAPPRPRPRLDPDDRPRLGGRGIVDRGRARLPATRRDRLRRGRGDRGRPRGLRELQRQLAAALRRPDARGDPRLRPRRPGGDHHAVPADGRDGARLRARGARATDRRGARGGRADAARATGGAVRDGLVPVVDRHEERLARIRRPRVCRRAATPRARSHAASDCPGARAEAG